MFGRGGRGGRRSLAARAGVANGVTRVEVENVMGEVQSVTVIGRAPGMGMVVWQEGVATVL